MNLVAIAAQETAEGEFEARWAQLARDVGLPFGALADPEIPLGLELELRGLDALVAPFSGLEEAALKAAELGSESSVLRFGMLGLAMAHARTVTEVVEMVLERAGMLWAHSWLTLAENEDEAWLAFALDETEWPDDLRSRAVLEAFCVTLDATSAIGLARELLPAHCHPTALWLPYVQHTAAIEQCLGLAVRTGSGETRVCFPRAATRTPLAGSNPYMLNRYLRPTAEMQRKLTGTTIVDRARGQIWSRLPPPSRDQVAEALGMSVRSLTRHLGAEGTSYAVLLQEARRMRAMQMLRAPDISCEAIAEQLGYADAPAFSRAFRRWAGVSPTAWRRRES